MRTPLRSSLIMAGLVALATSGCLMLTGQFVLTYDFAAHGFDPLTVNSASSVAGVLFDLKTNPDFQKHRRELKDITDLAVVGTITNLDTAAPVDIQVWLVPKPQNDTGILSTDAAVRAAGVMVWGTLHLGPGESKTIGQDESSHLFTNKQVVMNQARGDARFALYSLGSNGYHYRITHGAIIAVIAAGK